MFEGLSKKMVYIILALLIFNVQGEDGVSRLNNVSKLKIEAEVTEKNIDNLDEDVSYSNNKVDDLMMKPEAKEANDFKNEKEEQKADCEVIYEIDEENLKKINYDNTYKKEAVEKYEKENNVDIIMDNPENYSDINGITCFRGNNFRSSAAYGFVDGKEKKLEIIWNVSIGNVGRWTGVGWNGQPAIVEWSKELRSSMNIFDEKKNKDNLKEVIYGTLDSNVYFLDLDDGSFTRNKLKIPGPIKGSVTIDPRGIPLLYVGQGINRVNNRWVKMGYRIFSLLDQKLLCFINGQDEFAYRGWSAFDSTSIIDKKTDNMLICGENGIVYKVKLNTQYNEVKKELSIDPEVKKYRYRIKGNNYQGIENSIAVYKNLGFFGDNGGWIQCIDINRLKPVWIYNAVDDTDSTIVIDKEDDESISLYTGCEVDKQGSKGKSYIRKLNALSGEIIWERSYDCFSKLGDRPNNGGVLATPVIGKKSIKNLVVYNIARYGGFNKGLLIALDKGTGDEVWRLELNNYSWSSPVDIYTKEGEAYILQCDSAGKMYLIEGSSGEILDKISLGSNVEGSPAVYENMIVVGTRGQKIYGIKIK